MMESFHFLRPALLLLAPVVVFFWWLWKRQSDPLRGWRDQVEPELLEALVDQPHAGRSKKSLVLALWLLLVLASAGPAWRPEPSPFAEDAAPLIVLLKADRSMEVADPEPSRLERAHLKIRDLAKLRNGDPLGLIAYAGSAHLVLPPTKDTDAVSTMAKEVSPEIMPVPGNRLDLAIERAGALLDGKAGTLLIVTDVETPESNRLSEALKDAGSPRVHFLVIASPSGSLDSLTGVADTLNADLIKMTSDDADVEQIIRKSKLSLSTISGDGEGRWQDGGYFFVPVIALLSLLPFRREIRESKSA